MMSLIKIVVFLSTLMLVSAQVDPGAGTFQCYPCGRSDCYLSSTNTQVSVNGMGNQKCGTLQQQADARSLFPDECSAIQQRTLASSDPCNCKTYQGGSCDSPVTNTQTCNLCGGGNKIIGDPDKVIPNGILGGSTCIDVFDANSGGAFNSICSQASSAVKGHCQCITAGSQASPCIPVEDRDRSCTPGTTSCCDGSCKYLNTFGKYVCTSRSGNNPPAGYNASPRPSGAGCFSGHTEVVTAEKGTINMKDLAIGDRVLVGGDKYDTVYSFGHRHELQQTTYLSITTNDKSTTALELTHDHMVFSKQGQAVPAASLVKGDTVLLPSGDLATIAKIESVARKGVYAPFTYSGTLVVNGIVASSFIGLQEKNEHLHLDTIKTPLTFQWVAHAFESPHRLAYRFGLVGASESYSADGVSRWVELPYAIVQWLVGQNSWTMALILVPTVALLMIVWLVEQNFLLMAAILGLVLLARSRSAKKLL